MLYNVYSDYLKNKYGARVYKLPINIPLTCPNRDGRICEGGCIFCGSAGAGYECLQNTLTVSQQLKKNKEYIGKKYNAKKFIAYFQNFSNTYLPVAKFKEYLVEAAEQNVVGIDISTRPDCVSKSHLDILHEISEKYSVDITIELGLQTVNYYTLEILNRGHDLAQFIDAVLMIKNKGFAVCVHMIPDLPWDSEKDVAQGAKILSALKVDAVKLHSLYIVKNTVLDEMYKKGQLQLLGTQEYVKRCVLFLSYLSPEIVIERIVGRIPEADSTIANDNKSWWKIKDMIEQTLKEKQLYQGCKCDYLGGSAAYIE